MSALRIRLADGSDREVAAESTVEDVLSEIGVMNPGIVAGLVDGELTDLRVKLTEDCSLAPVRRDSPEGVDVLRHTSAHVMAQAVSRLYDDVEFAIGPTIEDGFYYDFDLEHVFTPEDQPKIEEEMAKIVAEDLPIEKFEVASKAEAFEVLGTMPAKFKRELVEDLPDDAVISFYKQGEFTDLCRGPHLARTGQVKDAFKLLNIAGAYWRGDERRDMLQRLYGTAWANKKALKAHLKNIEEAKKRDHRRVGKALDLFSFHPEAPGMPFFHPNGVIIYDAVVDLLKEMLRARSYVDIKTPIILNEDMWHRSGHWDHYRENMYYTEIDKKAYAIKPMNCPGSTCVFANDLRSYRELPIRMGELGLVHRHEKSGVLTGLFRVRSFTQDDAHIYCTEEQLEDEIIDLINLVFELYAVYGLTDIAVELSTRPRDSIGTDEMWEQAEASLSKALERVGIEYDLNPGDGAFYGPKIDFHVRDCLKRSWQCATIQVDFSMPERFDLEYVGQDGERHRPIMVHRAILGAVERFLGILIEHFGGAFPLWLAPEQVRVIPVSEDKQRDYTLKVEQALRDAGLRASADMRSEKVGYKIREAQVRKVPYMLVVGGREEEAGTVAVRRRDGTDLGPRPLADVVAALTEEFASRSLGSTLE
jgi:threonyl-tRNA synthetase